MCAWKTEVVPTSATMIMVVVVLVRTGPMVRRAEKASLLFLFLLLLLLWLFLFLLLFCCCCCFVVVFGCGSEFPDFTAQRLAGLCRLIGFNCTQQPCLSSRYPGDHRRGSRTTKKNHSRAS